MSFLRRRLAGDQREETPPSDTSDEPSTPSLLPHPRDVADHASSLSEEMRVVSARKLERLREAPRRVVGTKRRYAGFLSLGGILGLTLAGFFASNNDMIANLDLTSLSELNLDSILNVLPAEFMQDAKALQKKERDTVNYDSFAVGLHARSQGIKAKHPVIMIPGVISSGLESWATEDEDSRNHFRKRLWGSWSMMRALVLDKAAWKRKIMLDKKTGLDPPGVKLRAAQGFDAADFFITGYWIWNKILENLASIGYDPSNAFTASYDWRLSYADFEVRDAYFTRLKAHIELAVRLSGKKVVLLSHSMGSQVLFYFLHWVEAEGPGYGNGGDRWVDAFVDSWINVSGCMLGAVKGIPAVLSGEMKDTAQMNAFAVYGLEKFLSRHERGEIFRSMPGISSMLPMGGNAVWGNASWAPDDPEDQKMSFGKMISFTDDMNPTSPNPSAPPPYNQENATGGPIEHTHAVPPVLTANDALPFLFNRTEPWYVKKTQNSYSQGVAHTRKEVERNMKDPRKWINPLETRLPFAPNLKIYCFYGIGKETERAYFLKRDSDPASVSGVTVDTAVHHVAGSNITDSTGDRTTDHGVVMGEGDGTVNLLSAGYMCSHGWRNIKRYNPSGAKVTIFEMPHEPERFNPRGGPNTGDHVDILGRSSLNDLILRVAGGKGELIEETIYSKIREYSEKVKIYDDNDARDDQYRH